MSNIFISYAREDRHSAKRLSEALEMQNWTIWWDRDIPPGKSFDQVIEEALDSAQCVIVLWSKSSVASDWVKNEASEGARRRILVPVLIEEAKIPLEFRRIQTADLSNWDGTPNYPEFEILLRAISVILGIPLKSEATKNEFIPEDKIKPYDAALFYGNKTESTEKLEVDSARKPGWLQEHLKPVMFSGLGVAALVLLFIAVKFYYPPGAKPGFKPAETSLPAAVAPKPSPPPSPAPEPRAQPSPTPPKEIEVPKPEPVPSRISPTSLPPEARPEFKFPAKWRVSWRGGRTNALYTGSLSITDKIGDQKYSGLLLIKTPQGYEVTQDALVVINNSKVKIKCSNPSVKKYPADNFSLTLSGNTMKGIDQDVEGNIGLGVVFTAVE